MMPNNLSIPSSLISTYYVGCFVTICNAQLLDFVI